ncbi:hypothetical protein CPB84DRAFT_1788531 [Gymnopilus junonius]|uniref:UvrD-like helicase ATP-binding domain-containing protein n=1 Tax=Gymnopilus junonius TaxID=109634 RepID=A0A9P5TJJ6_GYMJU|nr:hypothetical protein CPB84DRAFT_1788531 [Gymnopilus junonius]
MSRKVSYRAGLFDSKNLLTLDSISDALFEFSGVISSSNCIQALEELMEESNIVELILSCMNDEILLQKWILEQFPSDPKLFETSFSCKLLCKLSKFFLFQSSADDRDIFQRYHQTVGLAAETLQSLSAMTFLEGTPGVSSNRPGASKKLMAKSSQREKKQAAKAARRSSINKEPFEIVEVPIPRTYSELSMTTTSFINRLKDILEYYLRRIRSPEISAIIQESFLQPAELESVSGPVLSAEISPPETPVTMDVPDLFPFVQPMKSAVYFDSPQGFGEWRILVSTRADKNLREHHKKSRGTFEIIVNKIKDLSRGHFSPDNHKRLSGPNTEIPIFEAKMTSDLRLIYQVDCVADYDTTDETQILRIFGIYTHKQMRTGLWDSVAAQLSTRGSEYRKKCLRRVLVDGDVYRPAHFSSGSVIVENEAEEEPSRVVQSMPIDHDNQIHRLLTLEKYVTISQELLDSIEADRDVTFPFEVSVHERTIIQHPLSCYVLGRSGTGKTTTMLFKMLFIERAYRIAGENATRPRQIFVTQSRVLASKVKELFETYLASLTTASTNIAVEMRRKKADTDEYDFLRNDADFADLENNLPPKFGELEDKHFPIFITIDHLYAMIEAELGEPPKDHQVTPFRAVKGKLVTFDRFLSEYWPYFNQTLKKRLHPSLIFNEIMGVILGSKGSLTSSEGHLDRATYEKLSSRTQPTFANHRSAVYDIFESYQRMKHELRDFDAPDRTRNILQALKQQPLPGQMFDQLYVDETQDNLLIDAVVLRMLCRNADGLFWAGDTAQTISNGSSFRFNDLKRVMFQIEAHVPKSTDSEPMKRNRSKEPKMFHLAVNYRSHAGIVNCAHSVIDLIQQYWPYSIDILPRELGAVVGAIPIFYRDIYPEFIRDGHFLSRDRNRREKIELGADQCILVRDDAAKKRLLEEIGKVGLVLTLYDSKGLEFNDVFLYNFFHDSIVDASQWRLVLNGILEETSQSPQAVPKFDPTRHAAICSELKFLYVAITRARNNLRIADESLKGESMRALWESRGEIQSCYPVDDLSDFAVPSSRDDWEKRAAEFFRHEKYALARDSYEKACKPKAAAISHAFYLRQVAIRTPARQKDGVNQRTKAFRAAAEAFSLCACEAQDVQAKKGYYRLSAKCSEQASDSASDLSLAAKRYRLAEDFFDAAKLFRRCGHFEDLHDILINHRDKIAGADTDVLDALQGVARLYFVSKKDYSKTHQLFSTFEEEIEFLEDCDFDLAQLDLLLLHGRKSEAAGVHLAEGRIIEAIDLFIDDGNAEKAKECIFQGLWERLSFGFFKSPDTEINWQQIGELLDRFDSLDQSLMPEFDLLELEMFRTIFSREFNKLSHLADKFLVAGKLNAALLCLDYQFADTPEFTGLDMLQLLQILKQFWRYICILQDLAFQVDPTVEKGTWALIGIKQQDDDFLVPPNSLIHRHILRLETHGNEVEESISSVRVLSGNELRACFHKCMQNRLQDRVARENDMCRRALGFIKHPCLRHLTKYDCDPLTCRRSHRLPDVSWFRHLVDLHLLQILIYSTIWRIESPREANSQQRFWIGRLYDVLNPPHYSLGSPCLVPEDDFDIRKALTTLLDWIRKITSDLDCWRPSFLTLVMQTADLAFTFDKKQASVYMYRSNFIASPMNVPGRYLRGETRQNTLHELLVSFNGRGSSSLLMGILFIRHIMELSIPVDINAYFAFIEKICGSLIAFGKYQWRQSFHNVVLPRSWLTAIMKQFDPVEVAEQDASRFWLLLQPLEELLRAIYFSSPKSEHLLYGHGFGNTIANQGNVIRSIYLSRICRCLGLLFYNIGVITFRNQIRNIFSSLRQNEHHGFSHLYARYIFAEDDLAILKATRRSVQDSPLDEMVQIFHSERVQYPIRDVFGLRRIVYTKQEDLIDLLSESSCTIAQFDKDVPQTLTSETLTTDTVPLEEEQEDDLSSSEGYGEAADTDAIPEVEIPEDVHGGHSEEEIAAALLLQSFCRKVLQRKHSDNEPGLDGDIYRWSLQYSKYTPLCLNRSYKMRMLCFLPLLQASLQPLLALLLARKKELNKMLTSEDVKHEQLDEVGLTLSRASDIIKTVKRLQNALHPKSELHRRENIDTLKQNVEEVLNLCGLELPVQLPEEVRAKLGIVHIGMIQTPPTLEIITNQNEKRPALNTEDLTDFVDHGKDWEDPEDDDTEQ